MPPAWANFKKHFKSRWRCFDFATCGDDAAADAIAGVAEAVAFDTEVVRLLVDHDSAVHDLWKAIPLYQLLMVLGMGCIE